jgi:protein-S-isoprenylcysteine O-methyltransferase Ste14
VLILKGIMGGLFNAGVFAVFLLVPAGLVPGGTWRWGRALAFLAVYGVVVQASILALAIKAPASLQVRFKGLRSKKQPAADKIITRAIMAGFCGWLAVIPADVFHWHLLPAPSLAASLFGGALFYAGFAVMMGAAFQNAFVAPIVEDQTAEGQVVVDTGLYGVVRHPMYMGGLLLFAGLPVCLESYGTLAGLPFWLVFLVARIRVEARTLRAALPGYAEYTQRVRYRLIPLVW